MWHLGPVSSPTSAPPPHTADGPQGRCAQFIPDVPHCGPSQLGRKLSSDTLSPTPCGPALAEPGTEEGSEDRETKAAKECGRELACGHVNGVLPSQHLGRGSRRNPSNVMLRLI